MSGQFLVTEERKGEKKILFSIRWKEKKVEKATSTSRETSPRGDVKKINQKQKDRNTSLNDLQIRALRKRRKKKIFTTPFWGGKKKDIDWQNPTCDHAYSLLAP